MTDQDFEKLLSSPESDTLDFKRDLYDFSGSSADEKARKRGKFLKDIVSMKNTRRTASAFIVLGVGRKADGSNDLVGISGPVDDADLQGKFPEWVFPHPF